MICSLAQENDCSIIAAGTHPFSSWENQVVTERDRYFGFVDSMQIVAKRLLIFGMHIHIGIEDRDLRIDIMNQMRYFMPHMLAFSTSSPFWSGENTGFKSYRSIVFEDLPRTGTPEYFDSASAHAESGDLAAAGTLILKALDQERRAGGVGPQVLQLIKPRD